MDNTRAPDAPQSATYPDLPKAMTSFGASVLGNSAYVYGGHFGQAHHYYDEGQSGDLLQLELGAPEKWEAVAAGPRLQGLALVAHNGFLYRLGGFASRNSADEQQDLWSLPDAERFDPQTRQWQELPPMSRPRSSFDATVLGNTLYVVGGWSMQGSKQAAWHENACVLNLSEDDPQWSELSEVPFRRRAMSVGVQDGKLFAIGGMQPDGNVTQRVATFDPTSRHWSEGPALPGEEMDGFGTACCNAGGRLYVSTSSGQLLRLSKDGRAWENAGQLKSGRFFHRLLPVDDHRLIAIGGASMKTGKFSDVESIRVPE